MDNQKFTDKARKEYEKLLQEVVFRSHRAAMMTYKTSSYHDAVSRILEYGVVPVGIGLASVIPSFTFLKKQFHWSKWVLMFSGVTGTNMLAQSGMDIYRSKTVRATSFTEAGAGWQKLEFMARSYLVRLDDPLLDVQTMGAWYEGLVAEREKVCKLAVIPETLYTKNPYTETKTVTDDMKKKDDWLQECIKWLLAQQNVEKKNEDVKGLREEKNDKTAAGELDRSKA